MRCRRFIKILPGIAIALLSACTNSTPVAQAGGSCATKADCMTLLNAPNCVAMKCVFCGSDTDCPMGKHCDPTGAMGLGVCNECIKDSDCLTGNTCVNNKCAPGCASDANCGNMQKCLLSGSQGTCVTCITSANCTMGQSCEPNSHTCVECLQNTDCAAGNICHQNKCVPGCDSSQHCANGQACNLSTGTCVDCVSDAECKTTMTPRCDVTQNKCVACLQASDNCPAGQYCAGTTCYPGCRTNTDCQVGNPSPASKGQAVCLVAKNTCVTCLADSDCSAQQICGTDHNCTMGCHSDAQCLAGSSCCNGQCAAINTTTNCGICGNACGSGQGCCSGSCTAFSTTFNCGGCGITCTAGQTCCGSGCATLLTDAKNCGACGNACGSGQICCAGQCRNPNLPGNCVDCTKTCSSYDVQGTGFKQTGASLTQITLDTSNNLTTLPNAVSNCTSTTDCPSGYFCVSGKCNPQPASQAHIWVANHDSNQVSEIDSGVGTLLGTFPSGGVHPSRSAMALDGSFWVGHRGPAQQCMCGSNGVNTNSCCGDYDPNQSNVTNILADGTIRCKITKAADGAPLPFVRALAIDKNGYVWFGTFDDGRLHKADPTTCTVVQDVTLSSTPGAAGCQNYFGVPCMSFPYGIAIDSNGIAWISTIGYGPWLGIDTTTGQVKYQVPLSVPGAGTAATYGVTIDKSNNVYYAQWCYPGLIRIDATSHLATSIPFSPNTNNWYCARGMSIDTDGNIWAAVAPWNNIGYDNNGYNYAAKFSGGTGSFLGSYRLGNIYQGVFINGDSFGNVWAAGFGLGNTAVTRFQRTVSQNGQVDFATKMVGGWPYSYADSTGIVLRTVTSNNAQDGTWAMSFDGQKPTTNWTTATWSSNTPKNTFVKWRFKAAGSFASIAAAPACGPFTTSPADLTTCNFGNEQWLGAFLELGTSDVTIQPTVSDFKVYYQN